MRGRRFIPFALGFAAFVAAVMWSVSLVAQVAAVLGVITVSMVLSTAIAWFRVRPRSALTHVGLALSIVALLPAVSVAAQLMLG
jgi:hypothetical protein